jgi:hypothetical protein
MTSLVSGTRLCSPDRRSKRQPAGLEEQQPVAEDATSSTSCVTRTIVSPRSSRSAFRQAREAQAVVQVEEGGGLVEDEDLGR